VAALLLLIRATLARRASMVSANSSLPAVKSIWLVLIVQNVLGHLVTGPPSQWNEVVFNIYYVLLFLITAVIAVYFQSQQKHSTTCDSPVTSPTA